MTTDRLFNGTSLLPLCRLSAMPDEVGVVPFDPCVQSCSTSVYLKNAASVVSAQTVLRKCHASNVEHKFYISLLLKNLECVTHLEVTLRG